MITKASGRVEQGHEGSPSRRRKGCFTLTAGQTFSPKILSNTPLSVSVRPPHTSRRPSIDGRSVEEVAGAGEVQRDPGRLGRGDDLVVPDRAARLDDRPHPGVGEHLRGRPRTGRTRRRRRPSPAARSPARETASRAESTRLTWPMPTPTVAPPEASRIALDFTDAARPPGEGQVGAGPRRAAGPGLQLPGRPGRRRAASTRSAVCTSSPPSIRRNSRRPPGPAGRPAAGCSSSPVSTRSASS